MPPADAKIHHVKQRPLPRRVGKDAQRILRHHAVLAGAFDRVFHCVVATKNGDGVVKIAVVDFAQLQRAAPSQPRTGTRRPPTPTGRAESLWIHRCRPPLSVRIALIQCNPLIGDLAGNRAALVEYCLEAIASGASLGLAPELALWGYPPRDLLLQPALLRQQHKQLDLLASALPAPMGWAQVAIPMATRPTRW